MKKQIKLAWPGLSAAAALVVAELYRLSGSAEGWGLWDLSTHDILGIAMTILIGGASTQGAYIARAPKDKRLYDDE